jgi:DNA-binding NarL/FixJ family response regulator
VQDWLSRPRNRASAAPGVYDALASLAAGARPAVIIVSIDAVDWSELEFFDHCRRLSEATHVYVAGDDHQQEKIEAACARGARPFDPDALDADVEAARTAAQTSGVDDLLAGPVPRPEGSAARPPATPAGQGKPEPAGASPAPGPPTVRLVTVNEDLEEGHEQAEVPVPWAPSVQRPQRTPPGRKPPDNEALNADVPRPGPSSEPPSGDSRRSPNPLPVELSPEELAALLGKPARPDTNPAREQRQ